MNVQQVKDQFQFNSQLQEALCESNVLGPKPSREHLTFDRFGMVILHRTLEAIGPGHRKSAEKQRFKISGDHGPWYYGCNVPTGCA